MAEVTVVPSQREDMFEGRAGDFVVDIDRGEVSSPRSIELVMLGLAACTIATVQHFLRRKGLSTDGLGVTVSSELDKAGSAYGGFRVSLTVDDRLDEAHRNAVLAAARTCRIHKTLTSAHTIDVALAGAAR